MPAQLSMSNIPSRWHPFIAQWLILAISVVILALAGAYDLYQAHAGFGMREHDRLLALTKVLQVNIEENLKSTNGVLSDLIKELKAGPVTGDFNKRLATLTEGMPSVRTITVNDATGTVRATNRARLIGTNFAQRSYFKVPQQNPDVETLFVSPPFRTATGVFSIVLSRVVPGPSGEFAGVITATLNPDYFYPLIDSVRYAQGMLASIHHGGGIVYLMAPHEKDDVIGVNLARPGSFYNQHKDSGLPFTVFAGKVLVTGEYRMIAQRDVWPKALKMDMPLVVAVSRPLQDIYAPWNRDLILKSAVFGGLVFVFALGLYLYQSRYREFIRKEAEAANALVESEWKLKTIFDTEPECVKVLGLDGALVQMNRAGLDMIEADTEEQVIGAKVVDIVTPEFKAAFTALNERVGRGESGTLEFEVIGLKGGHRWLDTHAVPMRDASGNIKGLLGVTRDVTERKKTERELERLAQTDMLTGLANRRHFMELAEQELSRTLRYGGQLSVLMMDIDHFKNVNDTYGHHTGDLVLQKLGGLCREALRDIDVVGRIGGEEFALVLPQTGADKAQEVAERLRKTVSKAEVPLDQGLPLRFALSIGVTTLVGTSANVDTLLDQADQALYEAKNQGRDRVCVFSAA